MCWFPTNMPLSNMPLSNMPLCGGSIMAVQKQPEILLVDDIDENLEVLANLLAGEAWDLAFATNGEDALEQIGMHPPDLILLDIGMPGLDGFEVCRRLKADVHTRDIPVVFLTGRSAVEDLAHGFQVGAVDYVTKPFQQEELRARVRTHLELYLSRTTIATQNQRLQEQLGVLRKLNQFTLVLQQAVGEGEILKQLETYLPTLIQAAGGEMFFTEGERLAPHPVIRWGDTGLLDQNFPRGDETPTEDLVAYQWSRDDVLCLGVPLRYDEELVGTLRLQLRESSFAQTMATTVADIIALTLHNDRLRSALQQEAIRDPLTGLYNRRFLDAQLPRELSRAERDRRPVALLVLDLDHFKSINDTFGHVVGDRVLVAVARCLLQNVRAEDLVCRFGGEEFMVVLPYTSLATAEERAEGLRTAISALVVEDGPRRIDNFTVSIGMAVFPDHAVTVSRWLQLADEALYLGKRQGRDRVVSAQALDAEA